jgi:hypothetical protein
VIAPWVVEQFFARAGDLVAQALRGHDELAALRDRASTDAAELALYRDTPIVKVGAEVWAEGMRVRAERAEASGQAYESARARAGVTLPDETTLRAIWPDLPLPAQNDLLRSGLDAVMLRTGRAPIAERATILWHGEGPDDLPGPGRRVPFAPWVD